MHILIVAATEREVSLVREKMDNNFDGEVEFLVSGVGAAATTYAMTKMLSKSPRKFNLAVNIGLAGTFREEIALGEVVTIISDQFADLGAEDGERFLSAFEIGLMQEDRFPFWNGKLKSDIALVGKRFALLDSLKKVKAITVNTVHGHERSIQRTRNKFHPDVESMEGAAFHYVCMLEKIPAIQLRAISNRIERRNRDAWNISLALNNLSETTFRLLSQL